MTSVALLGVGVMGETILGRMIDDGHAPADIVGSVRPDEPTDRIEQTYGIRMTSAGEAVDGADVVLIVVKPGDVIDLLGEIGGRLKPGAIVASVAAAVPTDIIESRLPEGTSVVRCMANTPARIGEGMTAVSAGTHASNDDVQTVVELLRPTGEVIVVPERYLDAVTAISGSGPAYVFFVVEAMVDAGVMLGLPRTIATELAVQAVYGSAKLLRDVGAHPTVLREAVTSPGGTTAAALRQLEEKGVRAAFLTSIEAGCDRAGVLAHEARARAAQ